MSEISDLRNATAALKDTIADLRSDLAEQKGDIKVIASRLETGDREAATATRGLADLMKSQAQAMSELRVELKELRLEATGAANGVRADFERQLQVHENHDAPHQRTLGRRLDDVETELAVTRGRTQILGWIGGTVGAALVAADVALVFKVFSGSG